MAAADITAQRLRELFDYDPATGLLTFRPRPRTKVKPGTSPQGRNYQGYVRVAVNRVMYLGHRLAWLHYYGEWPKNCIDHINGVRDDNRIENLRDVATKVNNENRHTPRKNSVSGVLGVNARPNGRFSASIKYGGKQRYLGEYSSIQEARAVYVAEKRKHHDWDGL